MTTLKERLRADLTAATKSRDELVRATLRLTLAAIQNAEVAGDRPRELSDEDVLAVLSRESKRRREAAAAFVGGGRQELAERERAEGAVLDAYLPAQLSDDELAELVRTAVAESGATGMRDMGRAMRAAQSAVAGRADGARVAALVRAQLT